MHSMPLYWISMEMNKLESATIDKVFWLQLCEIILIVAPRTNKFIKLLDFLPRSYLNLTCDAEHVKSLWSEFSLCR